MLYQIACYGAILKRNHLKFLIGLDGIKKWPVFHEKNVSSSTFTLFIYIYFWILFERVSQDGIRQVQCTK